MNISEAEEEYEIEEIDINGIFTDKITVAMVQLRSPFFDECKKQAIGGHQVLIWNQEKERERNHKILTILRDIKELRKDLDVILLPEYSVPSSLLDDLKKFSRINKIIIIGTYYDDRNVIDAEINDNYRKNICFITFPQQDKIKDVLIPKIGRTDIESDCVKESPSDKIKIKKFFWHHNAEKLYFQVFVCADFLHLLHKVDRTIGGLIFVPMCSAEISEFQCVAKFCIRPYKKFLTSRIVFLCNCITSPKLESEINFIGGTEFVGSYKGNLPSLKDEEGIIITTVMCDRIITKPTTIPSKFNTVIEDTVKFSLFEKEKTWKLERIEVPKEKQKWIINPRVFEYLSLYKYYTFARLKSYYHYRQVLKEASAKCIGLVGKDDIGIIGLGEEESDILMFVYSGRSDLAASLMYEESQQYFRAKKYMKYKGMSNIPELNVNKDYLLPFVEQIYQLANGNEDNVDKSIIKDLQRNNIILGKIPERNFEGMISDKKTEFILGVFLVRRIVGEDPCDIFEKEVIIKNLLKNPNVTDILFSDSGGGGGRQASMHYVIHIICEYWTLIDIVLRQIHEPLSNKQIEYGTRILPIAEYFSNSEYEALLNPTIGDPKTRREMREIMNRAQYKMKNDAFLILRLNSIDRSRILTLFQSCKKIAESTGLEEIEIEEKIIKFIRGVVNCKIKQGPNFSGINDDIKDLYTTLTNRTEKILGENLNQKIEKIGKTEFYAEINQHIEEEKKQIKISAKLTLGSKIISTVIWNSSHKNDLIIDEQYAKKVKNLQLLKIEDIRNPFSHGDLVIAKETAKEKIENVMKTTMALIDFISDFPTTPP